MGTWSTALYGNDLSLDVQARLKELYNSGLSVPAATRTLLKDFADDLREPEEAVQIWLAVADTQWKLGTVQKTVRNRLAVIVRRLRSIERWGTEAEWRSRLSLLSKLTERLNTSPPPPPKRRAEFVDQCDWQRGEMIAYQYSPARLVLLRVVGVWHGDGVWCSADDRVPILEVLDWKGAKVPPVAIMNRLKVRKADRLGNGKIILFRNSNREANSKRFVRLGIRTRPVSRMSKKEVVNTTCLSMHASGFDRDLKTFFNL